MPVTERADGAPAGSDHPERWATIRADDALGDLMLLNACAGDDQTPPGAYDAREHYTKYEFRVPMRDGVRLFTAVLVPKDASTTYPFMIDRSPFNME